MIISSLLNLVYKIFNVLFSPINIPSFDEESVNAVNDFLSTIFEDSETIIGLFIPWTVVNVLIPIVIAVVVAVPLYHFVMWILKKIPFLGVN